MHTVRLYIGTNVLFVVCYSHLSERTQWDHPEFIKALRMLGKSTFFSFLKPLHTVKAITHWSVNDSTLYKNQ